MVVSGKEKYLNVCCLGGHCSFSCYVSIFMLILVSIYGSCSYHGTPELLPFLFISVSSAQLRPKGPNARGRAQVGGPEVLNHVRILGIQPLVSASRGLCHPSQGSLRGLERLCGGPKEALRGRVCLSLRSQWIGKRRWALQRPIRSLLLPERPR